VHLSNLRGALRKLHLEHSGRWWLTNQLGVHLGNLISKQPWRWVNLSIGGALKNLPQEASGRQPPPLSTINRGRGLSLRVQHFFAISFHLKLVRRRRKKEKIQAEVLP